MVDSTINLAIVGVGKIVHDQHLPAIADNENYKLIASASPNSSIDGVNSYSTIDDLLVAESSVNAVSLCMPPQYRYQVACTALANGLHVLLEKPPAATVAEIVDLIWLSQDQDQTLFATWHSRFAPAIQPVKKLLIDRKIESIRIVWKEDVCKWHTGQNWVWQAGGLGVFDPGINALSMLTELIGESVLLQQSKLWFPENKQTPIAADLSLLTPSGVPIEIELDWRQKHDETWQIELQTDQQTILISQGGEQLLVDGKPCEIKHENEYHAIYARFSQLINSQRSDVDLTPLIITSDAFMLGERHTVDAFTDW